MHIERSSLVLHAKRLTTDSDIMKAKRLLYQVYIEEFNWQIPPENPSEIRVEKSDKLCFLQDRFDRVVNWFGIFHDKELVGCIRSLRRLNGLFELEYYRSLPPFLKKLSNIVENNRLAIKAEYRGTKAIYQLSLFAIEYELSLEMVFSFGTAPFSSYGTFYTEKLGYKKLEGPPFKYHPRDKASVNLIFLDLSNPGQRQKILSAIREHLF